MQTASPRRPAPGSGSTERQRSSSPWSAGADVSTSLRLALLGLPPFSAGPGIEVSPFVQVKVHFDATADTDGRISVVAPFRIGSGFFYDGSTHAGLSSPPRYEPEVGLPDAAVNFVGSIELEIVVALLIAIEAVPVGGPVIGPSFGVQLEIDSTTGWDLDGSIKILGGWAFPDPLAPPFPAIPEDLRDLHPPVQFDIDGAAGPFPVGVPTTRWSRVFDIAGDDGAAAALPAGDSLIVVEATGNPWMASLDELGLPQWQTTATDPWNPNGMVTTANGDVVVAGTSGNRMRADRFDPTGAPVWTRTLRVPDADATTCVAVVQTESNGTIVAGRVTRSSIGSPILGAIDEDGNVEWSMEVDMGSSSTDPVIEALARTPSGEIIAVGSVHYTDTADPSEPPIGGKNALILRLCEDGTLVSAFALGGTASDDGLRIAVQPDGSYAIAGRLPASAQNVWIASLTPDDTLDWSASYQSRPDDSGIDNSTPSGLATVAANGLLVSGDIGSPDQDAWLMRLNKNGMPVWVKTYLSTDTDDELSGVIALSDGVAAFGRTQATDNANGDLWIVRTNVDGMLHFTADSALTAVNTAVQWQQIHDHTVRALAPESIPTALEADPESELVVDEASAFGELVAE